MSYLADSPVPFRTLSKPSGIVGGDQGGWGGALAFHVGNGVPGGTPQDLYPFLVHIGGKPETFRIGGLVVERIVPLRHPYLPNMLALSARAEATGKGIDASPGWTDWRVFVDFKTVPYGIDGASPFRSIQRRASASIVTSPGEQYLVGGVPFPQDVGRRIPVTTYSVTLFNVGTVDDDLYANLSGCINSLPFMGRPAGTVRFDGLESQTQQTITFVTTNTVTLAFSYRRIPWNQLLAGGNLVTPLTAGGNPINDVADLTPIQY